MSANKILIFVVIGITAIYALGKKSRYNKRQCIKWLTIILTCFSGFRSWRMGDVLHYCNVYLECNMPGWELDFSSNDTVGLQLFFRICGQIGLSFEVCIFIIAAFVAFSLGTLVYRYSTSPYWSYVIYLAMGFYVSSFDLLKQVIAMGFIIFAMIAIIEYKPHKFLLFVILASLFHIPAVIFLIAYPFANKKIDISYIFIIIGMIICVYLFRDQIVERASELYYVDNMSFEATEIIGGKVVIMVLILFGALLLRPLRSYDVIYRQTFNIMVLAIIIQSFSVYDNVFTRLADYFYQFVVLFIPLMLQPGWEQAKIYPDHIREIKCFDGKTYQLLQLAITIFAILYYFRYIGGSMALLNEFKFFWEVDLPSSLELLQERLIPLGGV